MFTGLLVFDVLFGDVHSLKEKRSLVRPLVAELQRRYAVAAAEVGDPQLHRRAEVGVAAVGRDARHVTEVLDACERVVAARPELMLLSARRQLVSDSDWQSGGSDGGQHDLGPDRADRQDSVAEQSRSTDG